MRDIKFRGKSIDKNVGNKWVYGGVLTTVYGEENKRADIVHFDASYGSFRNIRINEDTLGQYTGIKDKNGKEIYEGDIIKFKKHDKDYVGFINYVECEWLIDGIYKLARERTREIEVIGNTLEDHTVIEEFWK